MTPIKENSPAAIALEKLIDEHGMVAVLVCLQDICNGKADHLRTNRQDEVSAKVWEYGARLIGTAQAKWPIT